MRRMRLTAVAIGACLLLSALSPRQRVAEPFVPVGVAVSDVPVEWQLLRERGFNTLTAELRWADGEPARGEYQLDRLERTIERAAAAGMRVVIRLETNAPPAWLFQQYPDGRFASGVAASAPARACMDHPGVRDAVLQFIRGVLENVSQRTAWIGLDVGSQAPAGFCSCPHTQLRYKEWSTPVQQTDRAAFVRFARRQDLHAMAQIAAKRGPRLLVSHAGVPSILQPQLKAWPAQDDWQMAPTVDLYGGVVGSADTALAVDGLSSATRGRGWSMIADRTVPASDVRMLAWAAVSRGARALTLTEWRDAPVFAGVLTRNPALFTELRPRPAKVAIAFDPLRGATEAGAIHQAFLERNIPVDFVHPDDESAADKRYPLVVRVSDQDVRSQVAAALAAYTAARLEPDVRIAGAQGLVETRFLESSNVLMLIGINHTQASQKVTMTFAPDTQEAIWQNMETGAGVNFIAGPDGPTYTYWFRPRDALVLMIRKDLR